MVFGYPIIESIFEKIAITIRPEQLTVYTRRGVSTSVKNLRLSSVIGIVIQQVGWVDGYGWGNVDPVYDCLLLTEGDTIPLGLSSKQCHQLQGLLSTTLEEFSRGY